ncbi:FliA/WhiG family RNA polymerase sigma factor [Siminovitchia sp. FSL H7-0308]|uniref:RNA polymerase sigma factor for flagellar operon FliA n=1 Tax=Siminovitchia thermophila TaxID=1245522 RepID=A0ABS2RAT7_9BACI|nr:FliA/WhiG family RNA polymerase sigma factor [Siminovitchia thermophila]MBM7716460.1 RNA polymerase sigma factor for flagellar operon FliA [Siminovitchia thermophila]ONK23222.1 RNA polymerase subunit sigma [Bacillus sp. VT-16-64]
MSLSPPLEERRHWDLWKKTRDEQSGNHLVKKYMPLVSYHVQRISVNLPKNVSREELRSLGLIGLLDAFEKFDHSRDLKFETYASFRIRGAILDGLRKEDWLPRNTRDKAKEIESVQQKLEQQYMRRVTVEEIAQELGLDETDVTKTLNEYYFSQIISVDDFLTGDEDQEHHGYIIKDEQTPGPEEQLVHHEWLEEMAGAIAHLTENEQLVLSLFYKEELTLTEIGQVLDLSTSRISQIHSKALFKLRNQLMQLR